MYVLRYIHAMCVSYAVITYVETSNMKKIYVGSENIF
jgi:hypothetical protein